MDKDDGWNLVVTITVCVFLCCFLFRIQSEILWSIRIYKIRLGVNLPLYKTVCLNDNTEFKIKKKQRKTSQNISKK